MDIDVSFLLENTPKQNENGWHSFTRSASRHTRPCEGISSIILCITFTWIFLKICYWRSLEFRNQLSPNECLFRKRTQHVEGNGENSCSLCSSRKNLLGRRRAQVALWSLNQVAFSSNHKSAQISLMNRRFRNRKWIFKSFAFVPRRESDLRIQQRTNISGFKN